MLRNRNRKNPDRAAIVFAILAALWVIVCIAGCGYDFASKFFDRHEEQALQYYNSRFPSIQYYIPGKWENDTTTKLVPTHVNVKLSSSNLITDTITKTIYIRKIRVDTIRYTDSKTLQQSRQKNKELQDKNIALKTANARLKSENSNLKSAKRTWMWIAICAIVIIAAGGAGWFLGKSKLL